MPTSPSDASDSKNPPPPFLPSTGFVRLPTVLAYIPVSKSAWWDGVRAGRFPAPIKIGPQTTAWRAEDIHKLINTLSNGVQFT